MKIRFNQIDDTNREFQLINGIYSTEFDSNKKWIWTSTTFDGVVSNINYVTLTVQSEIKNTFLYEDTSIDLNTDCLNVIKINTTGKKTFEVKLSNPYVVNGDDRILGIKIVQIMIDQDVIF